MKFCGDGQVGAGPPGCSLSAGCAVIAGQGAGCVMAPSCDVSQYQFADIDSKETVLTGTLVGNAITLQGCFLDVDGNLGNVGIQATIDAHTGAGSAVIYPFDSLVVCNGPDGIYGNADDGSPFGAGGAITIASVRDALGHARDSDGDGCPDAKELGNTAGQGGLRDPENPWDYFNPTHDHQNRVDDILAVVHTFFKDQGNAAYTIDTDRTALIGANAWNLSLPNGQGRVDDILASVKQFFHDC